MNLLKNGADTACVCVFVYTNQVNIFAVVYVDIKISLKIFLFFMCISLRVCKCTRVMQCLWMPKEGVRSPRIRVTDGC